MTVFELMATLGLDTTDFDTKLSGAVDDVEELSTKAEDLTNPTLGGTGQSVLKPLEDDAKNIDTQLTTLKEHANETSAVMEGFSDVVGDVVKEAIEGIIEFGAQAIEAASSTGSELALSFNAAKDDFQIGLESLKLAVGNSLLPVMEQVYEIGNLVMGRTLTDKLDTLAQQLETLEKLNLEKTKEQVKGFFGIFEEVEKPEEAGSVSDFTDALESQTEHWEKYANTLNSLKEKGVDPAFLAQNADGSTESLAQLAALDEADTAGLQTLMDAYGNLQTAQQTAAESMSSVTMAIDENATAIADAMAVLLTGGITEYHKDETQIAMLMQGYVDTLSEQYPVIESLVNQINEKLGELGAGGENPLGLGGVKGVEPPEGYVYKGKVGEGEKQSFYMIRVAAELDEESETNLQGEVESMTLQGEAELFADPESGANLQGYLDTLNLSATVNLVPDGEGLPGYATGLDYVPHDNYVARLHEGEAVLTKQEARRWRRGEFDVEGDSGIVVNQYITVAKNEDFGTEVRNALEMMRWQG